MTARKHLLALPLALLLFWAAPAPAQDKTSGPSGKAISSGTITMKMTQAGFLLGASGGEGVLTFQGHDYPFKIGGMSIGDIGGSRSDARGQVYNLKKIEDFPGSYVQGRAGYAMGEGESTLWLENTKGVVLKLRATTKGVALNLGGDALRVELLSGK